MWARAENIETLSTNATSTSVTNFCHFCGRFDAKQVLEVDPGIMESCVLLLNVYGTAGKWDLVRMFNDLERKEV
jgi:hypothetical protein